MNWVADLTEELKQDNDQAEEGHYWWTIGEIVLLMKDYGKDKVMKDIEEFLCDCKRR